MSSPFDRVSHDVGVKPIPPLDVDDPRVPMAEETSLQAEIAFGLFQSTQKGHESWIEVPGLAIAPPRTINLTGGVAKTSSYPGEVALPDQAIELPILGGSATAIVKEKQYLYFVTVVAEVGAEHDTLLGQVTFQYRDLATDQIESISKENARRYRSFWMFVLSKTELTAESLENTIPLDNISNQRRLAIANKDNTGFDLSTLKIYALDPNWATSKTYTIIPQSITILDFLTLRRYQNYQERGYTWGYNGEDELTLDANVAVVGSLPKQDIGSALLQRMTRELFAGVPGVDSTYGKTIQNLTAGPVGGNPGNAGEAASSPNGSVALANGQRISFSNQGYISKLAAQRIQATNDGNGNALVIFTLNSPPSGTRFSENATDHKIYALNGTEISSLGKFQNLGGVGALTWIGGANAASYLLPGQNCVFAPGIAYPAGSGFNVPFVAAHKVWVAGVEIDPANIRSAENDIDEYEAPANSEDYLVVMGRERAALHYVYKKISITTDVNGVIVIPAGTSGSIAFIEGVDGRIDKPIHTGLAPNTAYNCLLYYPPKSTESWQFLLKYPFYEGASSEDALWLNGAQVVSEPQFWIHTQGGGNGVFQGSRHLQYSPIAMFLPQATGEVAAYDFRYPVQLSGETYNGPVTLRSLPVISGSGLTMPIPGQKLSAVLANNLQARSLRIRLSTGGDVLGFRSPILNNRAAFQSVLAFVVRKGKDHRVCVLTRNGRGGESIAADSDSGTGIDIFKL